MNVRLLPLLLLALVPLMAPAAEVPLRGLPDFVTLAERVGPVVVNISSTQRVALGPEAGGLSEPAPYDELLEDFLAPAPPAPELFDSDSLGSGVVISADGEILTNYHVIQGASEIVVRLSDRRQVNARLIGADPASDLALLKIEAENLPFATIGDADMLDVGEWVMAIGSPFGFEYSVTSGIVSAKGRSVGTERYVPYIQTDVAINPGNSGGPLFNMDGEVVGINSQIYSRTGGFMGVSFAIPINLAIEVADQLRRSGRVSRGWLGVDIQDVTRELAESFGMARPEGALVRAVLPGSPAAAAGVQVGDVILSFQDRAIPAADALPPLVGRAPAGVVVDLAVLRGGESKTIKVTLGELPAEALPQPVVPAAGGDAQLGLIVRELNYTEPERLGVEDGVMVDNVLPGPGRQAGIRAGDVILAIDREPVPDRATFRAIVSRLPADRHVAVLLQRNGSTLFVPLRAAQ